MVQVVKMIIQSSEEIHPAVVGIDVRETGRRNDYSVIIWPTDCSPNSRAYAYLGNTATMWCSTILFVKKSFDSQRRVTKHNCPFSFIRGIICLTVLPKGRLRNLWLMTTADFTPSSCSTNHSFFLSEQ